jgi:hypothetical protein
MMLVQTHAVVPLQAAPDPGSTHSSPVQHPCDGEQAWPRFEQVEPGWHVPVVWPPGMTHDNPEQQSPLTVHGPFWGWQIAGGVQMPPEQIIEQQSEAVPQPASLPRQVGVPASVGVWQA